MTASDAARPPLSAQAWAQLRARLARSRFRRRLRLDARDAAYAAARDRATLQEHARGFVTARLAPAAPANDGRQTPMRGHPAFVAQHATATCCRGCLRQWHAIAPGRALSEREIRYTVAVITAWLDEHAAGAEDAGAGAEGEVQRRLF